MVKHETPLIIPNFNNFEHKHQDFQQIRDRFRYFDLKNVFKDSAVKKSVSLGQSLMIRNNLFPLKTLSIVLLYFEIRNSLLSTL